MNKKLLIILTITLLVVIAFLSIVKNAVKNDGGLISPGSWVNSVLTNSEIKKTVESIPTTSSYNPPKEIKYDSSTDLQQELDSINPQVLDEDFNGI